GLKRRPFTTAVIDGTDHSRLSRSKLLGAAAALSRHLRKEFSDERIAIVLPASKGSMLANLAVTLADKVPVDLNFTMGRAANESCCKRANLRVAISATQFMERLKDFPWPERVLKLDELVPRMKREIIFWWLMALLVPARLLLRLLQIPKKGGHREAVLLFTSGTTGEPKGVVVSHRNVVGNVSQFRALLDAKKTDSILASLPFFHTFGSTVTLWYPLIEGVRIVTYPNPLEAAKNAGLIERYKLTLLLATPTFLRGYLRKVEPDKLRSLRLVITGAEKLPLDLAKNFEGYLHYPERTGDVLQGGWLKTGDLGRFDEDGFLYIEGRLSRFSKIGGEMVPHEAIESKIVDLLALSGRDERPIAIMGVQDEAKGEALVLLSAVDIDLAQLRKKLHEAGVPNLWIPKHVQRVESI